MGVIVIVVVVLDVFLEKQKWLQEEVCVLLWRLHTLAPVEEEKS